MILPSSLIILSTLYLPDDRNKKINAKQVKLKAQKFKYKNDFLMLM